MRKQTLYAVVLLATTPIFFLSCQKEITQKEEQQEISSNAKPGKKIYVSTVSQLYAATTNPSNAGCEVILAPGTYVLVSTGPNAGRIELQADMELRGQPGQPEQVIIDGSGLPATSFSLPVVPGMPIRTGCIRMGRGNNSLEWLTVIGNSSTNALSVIDVDLDPGDTYVRVSHSIISGGQIGIDLRNAGTGFSGRHLEADISNNEILNNTVGSGNGITIQNSVGANNAIIEADLNGNNVHGNKAGLRTHNQHSNNARITIQSHNDRFDENGIGMILNAGLHINPATTLTTANNNILSFEAHGTSISNNTGPLPPENPPPGAMYLGGGVTSVASGRASGNTLEVKLWGCQISGNQGAEEINAFGARSLSGSVAGTYNTTSLHLHGVSANVSVAATASFPTEPAGTNTVNIYRN